MTRPAATPRPELPAFGSEGKDRRLVQEMFDRVAPRYDLANAILSFGQDAHWRRVTAQAAQPAGRRILDVAAGPGNVAVELLRRGAAEVVALDLSFNMLAAGAERWGRDGTLGLHWVNADGLALPFADDTFDAVTISFGLRNLPDPPAGIAEFARVTRPGGSLVVCEFARPTWSPFRTVYERYLLELLPRLARVVSSDPTAYVYLARSIQEWPDRRALARWCEAAGYADVTVKDLSGGVVALHRGRLGRG